MTQRLCQAVAEAGAITDPAGVDRLCQALFLTPGPHEQDDNLLFVRERLLRPDIDRAGLLTLYSQVHRGHYVPYNESHPLTSQLRLAGIIRVEQGRLRVRNRIYACVFDRTWIRTHMPGAELRRQRVAFWRGVVGSAAVIVVLLLAGVGVWYWDAKLRRHVAYYAGIRERWGEPEGLGQVTTAVAQRRIFTYKVTRRGRAGLAEKIGLINGYGACPEMNLSGFGLSSLTMQSALTTFEDIASAMQIKVCSTTIERDAQGRIMVEKSFDQNGRLLYEKHVDPERHLEYYIDQEGRILSRVAAGIAYARSTLFTVGPHAGLTHEVHYTDKEGKAQPSAEGFFGYRIDYNARGFPVQSTFLDAEGTPKVTALGAAMVKLVHDQQGNITEMTLWDAHEQPTLGLLGAAKTTITYDLYGNVMSQAYFDAVGRPVVASLIECAKTTFVWNTHGQLLEQAFFAADGQPMLNTQIGAAKITQTYDTQGRRTEMALWDVKGQPVAPDGLGWARATLTYEKQGEQVEVAIFGADGQLKGKKTMRTAELWPGS